MNKKLLGILSTIVLLNTACSPKQDDHANSSAPSTITSSVASIAASSAPDAISAAAIPSSELVNTYWKLIFLNDTEIVVAANQREPHIILNTENRVSGSDGCNSLSGAYTLDAEKLSFGPLAGTRMACAEGADQSQAFNDALTKVATFTQHSDQLELRDATGLVIARFKAVALP